MRGNRHVSTPAGGMLLLLSLLPGCSLSTNLDNPEWARLVLTSSSTFSLELLMSQKFLVTESSLQLMDSTKATISVPFDQRYTLEAPARVYFRLTNLGQGSVSFHYKFLLEERPWLDEDKELGPGEKMEFVYRYNMPTPNY